MIAIAYFRQGMIKSRTEKRLNVDSIIGVAYKKVVAKTANRLNTL